MALTKLEIKGNTFYATNQSTGAEWKLPSADVRYEDNKDNSITYYDRKNIKSKISLDFNNILDSLGVPFTNIEALTDWNDENLGLFNGLPISTIDEVVDFVITNDYQIQSSETLIDSIGSASYPQFRQMLDIIEPLKGAILDLGDVSYLKNQNGLDYTVLKRKEILGEDRTFFQTCGNHDDDQNLIDATRYGYEDYLVGDSSQLSSDDCFYHCSYQGIDIFVLRGYKTSLNQNQKDWITSELATLSATGRTDIRILVLIHATLNEAWSPSETDTINRQFLQFEYDNNGAIFLCSLSGHEVPRGTITSYPSGTVLVPGEDPIDRDMVSNHYICNLPPYSRQSLGENITLEDIAYSTLQWNKTKRILSLNGYGTNNQRVKLYLADKENYTQPVNDNELKDSVLNLNHDFTLGLYKWDGVSLEGNEVTKLITRANQLPQEHKHLLDEIESGNLLCFESDDPNEGWKSDRVDIEVGEDYVVDVRVYITEGSVVLGNRGASIGLATGDEGNDAVIKSTSETYNEWVTISFTATNITAVGTYDQIIVKARNKKGKFFVDYVKIRKQ